MPFETAYVPVLIHPDGMYETTAQIVYRGRDERFVVPPRFLTDLASVPRLMTWLVPIAGVHDRAAIVHDWLCTSLADYRRYPAAYPDPPASARDTDGIFRRILRELGVPLVRRWLYWTGVRWGALANPARRAGWAKDAPLVLGISLLALPFLLLPALFVGAALLIDRAVEAIAP